MFSQEVDYNRKQVKPTEGYGGGKHKFAFRDFVFSGSAALSLFDVLKDAATRS
jgi:hypothetical protein